MALTFDIPRGEALTEARKGVPAEAWARMLLKLNCLRRMSKMTGAVMARAEIVAMPSQRLSAAQLKRDWYAYQKSGGDCTVLLDGSRVRKSEVPQEFLDEYWFPLIGKNNRQKGLTAYHKFLREWCVDGKRLPGIGTWQEWASAQGVKVVKGQRCPWGAAAGHQPPRLSYRNLMNPGNKPGKVDLLPMREGLAGVRMVMPGVHQDLSKLRFMEVLVIDDAEPDFWVIGPDGRPCKILMVGVMDAASRMIIRYILRPKLEHADGSKDGICRDMVHRLLAGTFREYGYPVDYGCTVIAENAAAAVTAEFEAALSVATHGNVKVQRTSLWKQDTLLKGIMERSGNPRGKLIEGLWALAWNELGWLPGQSGANWTKKPAALEDTKRAAQTLAWAERMALALELPARGTLGNPLLTLAEARREIDKVWTLINGREEHAIPGFLTVSRWKYPHEGYAEFKPYAQLAELARDRGFDIEAAINMKMVDVRRGKETPLERAARLRGEATFEVVSEPDLAMLSADLTSFKYGGTGSVRVIRGGQTYWFRADTLGLVEGRAYVGYFDAEEAAAGRAKLVVLEQERRAYAGTAEQQAAAAWGDRKALAEQLAQRERTVRTVFDAAARRANTDEALQARLANVEAAEEAAEELGRVLEVRADTLAALPSAAARNRLVDQLDDDDTQAAMMARYGEG